MKVHLIAAASFALIVASPALATGNAQPRPNRNGSLRRPFRPNSRQGLQGPADQGRGGVLRGLRSGQGRQARQHGLQCGDARKTRQSRSGREMSEAGDTCEVRETGAAILRTAAPRRAVRVWDPLVRIFHWSLALSVATAWVTSGEWERAHEVAGYVAGGLVAARIAWGFSGSRYARFRQFVRPAPAVVAYLKAIAAGNERRYLGHNPAGGAMIVALLVRSPRPRQPVGSSRLTPSGDRAHWS